MHNYCLFKFKIVDPADDHVETRVHAENAAAQRASAALTVVYPGGTRGINNCTTPGAEAALPVANSLAKG